MIRIIKKIIHLIKFFSLRNRLAILFSQPLLILLLPRTYWRLAKNVFHPQKIGSDVIGFSPHMSLILSWYLRTANCVHKYGRNGYVFEDGLGLSLKERFWLNSIALKIYGQLKIQKFTLLASLLLLSSLCLIGWHEKIPTYQLIIFITLCGASSLFLIPFLRLAKPETLSWSFAPLAFYAVFTGHYYIAGIMCLIISIANFTTTLLVSICILTYAIASNNILNGIFVIFTSSLKLGYDLWPFFKNSLVKGILEILGGNKPKSRHDDFLRLRPNDLYLSFFYLLYVATLIFSQKSLAYVLVLLIPWIIYINNQNLFRFADSNTFFRLFFILTSLITLLNPTPLIFISYLMLIFLSPLCLLEVIEDVVDHYPHIKAYSIKKPKEYLKKVFSPIPSHSRIIFETHNSEKNMSGFSTLLFFFESLFLEKGTELIPMEWLRATQMNYFINEFTKINQYSNQATIKEKCQEIGANYLLVYSEKFAQQLREWNYQKTLTIKWRQLKKYFWNFDRLTIPEKNLYLFKPPFAISLIEPSTHLLKQPNLLKFEANPKTQYIIKYNYHPSWQATQGQKKITIKPSNGKLSFITLNIKKAGSVILHFNTNHWSK
ncbi:MAG: hypothetical protein AUJ33_00440 [Parcubacteria group bacterium CG1_02_40_25]|nr:MAG: hypothetical protein AUJ33_00440 [Parcubacteria group bacterium CG1_02_40_25]